MPQSLTILINLLMWWAGGAYPLIQAPVRPVVFIHTPIRRGPMRPMRYIVGPPSTYKQLTHFSCWPLR